MKTRGDGRVFRRKNSAFWWCGYSLRGKEFRESTGEIDEQKARKFLKRRLKEVGADQIGAKPFVGPQQERVRVSELLDALKADYELRGKASPQFKAHLKPIRDYFGDWRALEVTTEAVDRFINEMLTGTNDERAKSPATVNRTTQLLSQSFKLAIERRRLSIAPVIRHMSESGNARQGFFGDTEFRNVVGNLPDYLRDFAMFAYLTGWRRGEVASLEWSDVDGDVIRLRAENSKNGEPRSITIDGELAELMERRRTARTVRTKDSVMIASLVFHHRAQPLVDIRKAWATACVAAGVGMFVCPSCNGHVNAERHCDNCDKTWSREDLKYVGRIFHDLRRTAVRNMVRAGVHESVAMSISGHKTRAIFDRYNIVSERDLREAMQRTQAYLANAPADERTAVMPKQSASVQ